MREMAGGKEIKTITDYMGDETRVSPAEREQIESEVARIGKRVEEREKLKCGEAEAHG
ncbi:MAG: hypothetical protein LBG50_01985 [Clostridiales Family XIII bacterium]|nr:hypothetical protein [Clostridiales Family XIII bacterium]